MYHCYLILYTPYNSFSQIWEQLLEINDLTAVARNHDVDDSLFGKS